MLLTIFFSVQAQPDCLLGGVCSGLVNMSRTTGAGTEHHRELAIAFRPIVALPRATRLLPVMEDLSFAYLADGAVVVLDQKGVVSPPPCNGLRVLRWLFCGVGVEEERSSSPNQERAKHDAKKEMWYQSDYLEADSATHKEHAPLLVTPSKL